MSFRFTDRHAGNLGDRVGDDPGRVAANRDALAAALDLAPPTRWVWLHQDHTDRVVTLDSVPDAPPVADGAVTTTPGLPLVVLSADCTPLLLEGPGAVGVVHGGWKGLLAGIVDVGVAAMRAVGVEPQRGVLGPCARPGSYEFDDEDVLGAFVERFGASVRSHTRGGTPSLDLPEVVRVSLEAHGIPLEDLGVDTITSLDHFSHRREGTTGRQALVAWV